MRAYFEVKLTGGFTYELEDGQSPEDFLFNLSDADLLDFVGDRLSVNDATVVEVP